MARFEDDDPGTYDIVGSDNPDEYPETIEGWDEPASDLRSPVQPRTESVRKNIFTANLPLETETARFILVNALDLFMTFLLLYFSNRGMLRKAVVESNPVADFFIKRWSTSGLVFFKFGVIAFVVILAQVVARQRPATAKRLLDLGSLFVGAVVVYSLLIMLQNRL
ncbi:MAG: DUF5658 family protein [Planctomycetaceae bacterium]